MPLSPNYAISVWDLGFSSHFKWCQWTTQFYSRNETMQWIGWFNLLNSSRVDQKITSQKLLGCVFFASPDVSPHIVEPIHRVNANSHIECVHLTSQLTITFPERSFILLMHFISFLLHFIFKMSLLWVCKRLASHSIFKVY